MEATNLQSLAFNINRLAPQNKAKAKKNTLILNKVVINIQGNLAFWGATKYRFKSLHELLKTLRSDFVLDCTIDDLEYLSTSSAVHSHSINLK